MKGKLLVLTIVFFILFSIAAASQSVEIDVLIDTVGGTTPSINVNFDEDTNITDAVIYKVSDHTSLNIIKQIPINKSPATGLHQFFILTPTLALSNGLYYIQLDVADEVGNPLTYIKKFVIDFPELDMIITQPRLAVSNSTPFSLRLNTQRYGSGVMAECKYSDFNPNENFEATGLTSFEVPGAGIPSQNHIISNAVSTFGLSPNAAAPEIYVTCKETVLDLVTTKRIYPRIDTINPVISSYAFDPPKLIEYPETTDFELDLLVDTTEPTLCKYAFNGSKPYNEMVPFDDYTPAAIYNYEAYKESHTQTITIPFGDDVSYPVSVMCEDMAGHLSAESSKSIQVDLSASIGINVKSPPKYSDGADLTLNITTAKKAYCSYNDPDYGLTELSEESNQVKNHFIELGSFTDGQYSFDISCTSGFGNLKQTQDMTYSFVVDNSPPLSPAINGSYLSCSLNPLQFSPAITFVSNDSESGVSRFDYTIPELNINGSGNNIASIPIPSGNNATSGMPLSMSVTAVNGVGMRSAENSIILTVDPQHPRCHETDGPTVSVEEEKLPGETRITLVCSDESGCDETGLLYALAGSPEECNPLDTYYDTFSITYDQYLCYEARDIYGNNASGGKPIIVELGDTCGNGVQDGDETDVDCGGSCGGSCGVNQTCLQDSDCSSDYCSANVCQAPACDDGIENGEETDVDCGGDCEGCALDSKCRENSDCIDDFCNPDTNICSTSSCDDGVLGPEETDIDCGGICGPCPGNSRCMDDGDCQSNNCKFGYCEQAGGEGNMTGPVEPGYESKEPSGIGNTIAWIILILGFLAVGGGIGYLVYKHMKKTKSPQGIARPPVPKAVMAQRVMPPGTPRVSAPRMPSAARRPPAPSKEQASMRKHMEEVLKQRREKREKLFKTFEVGGAESKQKKTGIFGEEKEMPKPKPSVSRSETQAPSKPLVGKEETGWIPLGNLFKKKEKKEKPKPKPKAVIRSAPEFEKLEGLEKGEEDVFEKLGKSETSGTSKTESDEDIFKRIEQVEQEKEKEKKNKNKK